MSDGVKSALPVVGCDAVYRGKFHWTTDSDGGYTASRDIAKNFVSHLCAASGHDDSVDTMIHEGLQAGTFLMNASAGCGNECGVSGCVEDLFYAIDELCGEGIGDVGQEDADGVQVADSELAGDHVGPVVQLFHGI